MVHSAKEKKNPYHCTVDIWQIRLFCTVFKQQMMQKYKNEKMKKKIQKIACYHSNKLLKCLIRGNGGGGAHNK